MRKILIFTLTSLLASQQPALTAETQTTTSSKSEVAAGNGKHYGLQKGDLPNFHEVHPFLYRGGEPTPEGLKKLKEMGIATVIDLRARSEQKFDEEKAVRALGMKWIYMPMTSQPPTKKQVDTMIKEIESAASGKAAGPVFLHCAHGSDRTGCMVGIWRVTHDKYDYDQAYQEMRKYWFTPKFTRLSGAVKEHANKSSGQSD